jgi:hypothetical protein
LRSSAAGELEDWGLWRGRIAGRRRSGDYVQAKQPQRVEQCRELRRRRDAARAHACLLAERRGARREQRASARVRKGVGLCADGANRSKGIR